MSSFLMKCPQCSTMIAKGNPCPDCNWSDKGEEERQADLHLAEEFARRQKTHTRNYAVYMVLMIGTGLIGLLTAYMWFRFIYFGDVVAFVRIGLLTVLTAGLGVVLKFSKKICPIDLNCPACNVRLDQLGVPTDQCPSCSAQLVHVHVPT